jgi:hypothetical protein
MRRRKKIVGRLTSVKAKQRGFTLPLSISVGISMLLLGSLMIARSNVDQVSAIAQVQTAGALSVAEAGVARTLSQLNSPAFARLMTRSYEQDRGDGREYLGPDQILRSGDESNPITNEWDDPSTACVGSTTSVPADLTSGTVGSGSSAGTYQVLAYRYNPNTETGTLLVEGRYRDSISRVQVSVTRRVKPSANSNGFPGLYASESIDLGNNDVLRVTGETGQSANVICRDCRVSNVSTECLNGQPTEDGLDEAIGRGPNSIIDGEIILGNVSLPPMPTPPNSGAQGRYDVGSITSTSTFPRSGDTPDTDGVYHYVVDSIDLSGNRDLTINTTSSTKVRLYVSGNVSFSGNAAIGHTGSPERLAILGTGDNSQTITLSGGSTAPNAFVFAPNATIGINGGSSNPDFKGAVWGRRWNGSSSNNAEIVVPDNMPELLRTTFGNTFAIAADTSSNASSAPASWSREGAVRP